MYTLERLTLVKRFSDMLLLLLFTAPIDYNNTFYDDIHIPVSGKVVFTEGRNSTYKTVRLDLPTVLFANRNYDIKILLNVLMDNIYNTRASYYIEFV